MTGRRRHDDTGFTLIELMVVVLIIAVLLSVAIPTFLAARNRSSDRLAQTSLRTALNNARVVYSDGQSFSGATDTGLHAAEASLTFVPASSVSADGKVVSVSPTDGSVWYGAAHSTSGSCFFLRDSGGSAPTMYLHSSQLACDADTAAAHAADFAVDGW